MALGVPLSSLDVVVGISGVHYVLQGLRQIDRELDRANQKKVRAVLDFPDVEGQIRGIRNATSQAAGGMGQLMTATQGTMAALRQPVANPFRQMEARATIQQFQQVRQQVQVLRQEADLAGRQFAAAQRQLNSFLSAERPLTQGRTSAVRRQQTIQQAINAQMSRDFTRELLGTSQGQLWVSRMNANDVQRIQRFLNARVQSRNNTVQALQQQMMQEQLRQQQFEGLLNMRSPERNRLMNAANQAGTVNTAAQTALQAGTQQLQQLTRAAAMARQYLADTARHLNPLQYIGGVLRGIVSFVPGILSLGMGFLRFGGSVLGAAGHVGMFALKVMGLPAIMGPLTGGLSLIADNFTRIASSIALVVGAVAALSFKAVIQEGMELEQSLSSIKAVAQYSFVETGPDGKATVNTERLNNAMRDLDFITIKLGADTAFSNQEVAYAMELMLRGGTNIKDVTEQTVRAVLNLSTATGATLESSAGAINDIIGMFGISGARIPELANMIAGAVNTSRMDVPDFINALRQVGPLAAAVGMDPEDVATSLALLGQKGFRGEIAGTAFRNMLLYANPRSKPAQEALKSVGLWVDGGMTPGDPEDPAYQAKLRKYNDDQNERRARLAMLQQRLIEQQSSGAATSTIMNTRNQIAALENDIAQAKRPVLEGTAGGGHSKFFDDRGELRPMEEIIQLLTDVSKGMSDQEKAEFYQDVFGTRSGSAALLFSGEDAAAFKRTKELISAVDVQTLANFKLDNVAGAIELLTGSLKSLAGVVFINWIASPLKNFIMWLDEKADVVLDFFGRKVDPNSELAMLFGPQARGKMAVDQLIKELGTGNIEAFIGNLRAIVPELMRFEGGIRKVFRVLQLVRDGVITFVQAFRGNWAGQATREINGLIRIIGVFGLYWGRIWQNVMSLLRGDIDLKTFFSNLGKNFLDLIHNIGLNLSLEGPTIIEALRTVLKGAGDIGKTLWEEVAKPGLSYLWNELKLWWDGENGKELRNQVGSFLGAGFDFLTRRRVKIGTEITEDATGNPVKTDIFSDPGALDYLMDFLTGAAGVFQEQVKPVLTAGYNGMKEWLDANGELLKTFGRDVIGVIGQAMEFAWADEGLGVGRGFAKMLQSMFGAIGTGIISLGQGNPWDELVKMLNGSADTSGMGTKGGRTIADEFKIAFAIMAFDIIMILALIIQTFLNMITTAIREVIKGLVGIFFVGLKLIFDGLDALPDWAKKWFGGDSNIDASKERLANLYHSTMGGIDKFFENFMVPMFSGITPEGWDLLIKNIQHPVDPVPEIVQPGKTLVEPTTGSVVWPEFVNAGGGATPGSGPGAGAGGNFQLIMGPNGPVWIPKNTTPGTADIPSTYNPNDPFNWREDRRGERPNSLVAADTLEINAYGLGVDELLDQIIMRLEARYGANNA